MSGWNEQTLRAAASWKAFKEGKALFECGAVTEAKAGQTGWRGTVSSGKRPIRVSVTVKSATDLETRCSCPESQASGEFCKHAVATGLATLAGTTHAAPSPPTVSKAAPAPRDILLPPHWLEALARGKVAATAAISSRNAVEAADLRLADWLAAERVVDAPNLHLHLADTRAAGFLEAIAGHPGVIAGKERAPVLITTGHRILLADASLRNDEVLLVPASDSADWFEIGGSFWQAGANFLNRAGTATTPSSLSGVLKSLARGETAVVPVQRLLENLDSWQDWLAFPPDGWLESLHFIPAAATFGLTLEGSLQHLEAGLKVTYRDAPPVVPGLGIVANLPHWSGTQCEIRDLAAEERAVNRLEKAGFRTLDRTTGTWSLSGETTILQFLSQTLPGLRKAWNVTEGTRFSKANQQIAIVSPKIDILGSGEDWLGFNLSFQTSDGIEVPREEIQRLLRAGKNTGRIPGGRQVVISDDMASVIEPLFSELDLQQKSGHFEASARSGALILEIRKKLQNQLEVCDFEDLFTYSHPPTLQAELRPYQERGMAWMLDRTQRFGGALLADDMGLGKTIQTIALIEHLLSLDEADCGVILVVVTTSLLENWRAELGRFAPKRRTRILHGSNRDQEREKLKPGDVAVTSYGTLARDLAWHLRQDYRAVVVDEASLMRNPDTDHAKAVAKLRTKRRIALTGTPVENGVRDLWSVFRFIQPGWLGGREEFRERYEMPLAIGESTGAIMERLKLKISPFLLRRTKEQVAPELPSKLLIDEFCDLSPDQQSVYRDLLAEGRKQVESIADSGNSGAARMRMLTALLRLRQTCCDLALLGNERLNHLPLHQRSAKMERLFELLEEALNANHKVLVFSQFQKQLLEIQKCLIERDWACLRLDGQTRNRHEMVEKFQAPQGPPVFLISLKAGGYGLNLTAADTVIHFDPWWNPAAEAQATDRAHRIGQTRPVTVYRLLTRGTVEEQVVRLQARKRELASEIDEAGAGDATGWSMDDLKAVLSSGGTVKEV
jgi:superfamily II DNA or RNA helicase